VRSGPETGLMRRVHVDSPERIDGIHHPLRQIFWLTRVGTHTREREVFDKNRLPKKQTGTTL
jgi:hypothetical protein